MKVIIVAAHPDDEILGCGGFMSRYKHDYDINILIIGKGRGDEADQMLDMVPLKRLIDEMKTHGNYDMVFTHHGDDGNQDHRAIYEASRVAYRDSAALLTYDVMSPHRKSERWSPNYFVGLSEQDLNYKLGELQAKYASEVERPPHPRSLEKIMAESIYYGGYIKTDYAEAFRLEWQHV